MSPHVHPTADRIGRTLLALCALATVGALAQGIQLIAEASDDDLLTQAWRTLAYVVFAGLWGMLAWAPRQQRGMWELLLFHKIAITLFALAVIDKPTAVEHVVIDGTVVVATLVAYVLCRGWYTWRPTPVA